MKGPRAGPELDVERLFAELCRPDRDLPQIVSELPPDDNLVLALLRRPVPRPFLERLASTAPWSERPRVLAGVARSPRASRALALKLLPGLFWRDLVQVAATPHVHGAVRARAESLLREQLEDLRLGDRVSLARLATNPVLVVLLRDGERRVVRAALANPRMREADVLRAIRSDTVSTVLLEEIMTGRRWSESYAARLELVLQTRTPLALALAQLSSLVPRDLRRVADARGLHPLVKAAAQGLVPEPRNS